MSALSGGNNLAITLFLNASPYLAIFHPCRPRVRDHNEATTILTQGDQDDPPEEVLRINLCITGSPDFGLQYRGHPPLPAAPGDHRVINSDFDHRVWVARKTPLQRIHLVLGLVPWLDYDAATDTWTPNRHLGKTHPFDLIRAGLAWE